HVFGKMDRKVILAAIMLQLATVNCGSQSTGDHPSSIPFSFLRLATASHPTMPITVDVNKDGNLDIVVANGSGSVSVYLGDGKGGFTQVQGSPFAAGENCADIAAGDFNLDGNLDLAIANHGIKTVTILLGNGKGQFSLGPGSPINVASNPHPH